MNDRRKTARLSSRLRIYTGALATAWTIIVAVSLAWNLDYQQRSVSEAAQTQARATFEKDVLYRRWNAAHGGVYVPVTEATPPNPFLSHIPERDLTTPSGRPLTLINPAYMTRQVHELAAQGDGVQGHITSLTPLRPENAPDPWEEEALETFEQGETEASAVADYGGRPHMRLMRPMITEQRCLKCHGAQGYKVGDIRGGVSVSVPLAPYQASAERAMLTLSLAHGALWLLGLTLIGLGGRALRRRLHAQAEMKVLLDNVLSHSGGDALMATDLDLRILLYNSVAEQIFGYTAEEVVGQSVLDLHLKNKVDPQRLERALRCVRETGVWEYDVKSTDADGNERCVHSVVTPLKDGSGVHRGFVLRSADVTQRRAARHKLEQTVDKLERFNRVAVGREHRIIELKHEVNALLQQQGRPGKYKNTTEENEPKDVEDAIPERIR